MRLLTSRDGHVPMEEAATVELVDGKTEPWRPAADHRFNAFVTVAHGIGCQQNLADVLIPVGNVLNERAGND